MDGLKNGVRALGPASLKITYNTCVAPHLRGRLREITSVCVEPEHRRQGHGNALMGAILMEADAHGVALLVQVNPYDNTDNDMDRDALSQWYARKGFVQIQDEPRLMVRMPEELTH